MYLRRLSAQPLYDTITPFTLYLFVVGIYRQCWWKMSKSGLIEWSQSGLLLVWEWAFSACGFICIIKLQLSHIWCSDIHSLWERLQAPLLAIGLCIIHHHSYKPSWAVALGWSLLRMLVHLISVSLRHKQSLPMNHGVPPGFGSWATFIQFILASACSNPTDPWNILPRLCRWFSGLFCSFTKWLWQKHYFLDLPKCPTKDERCRLSASPKSSDLKNRFFTFIFHGLWSQL